MVVREAPCTRRADIPSQIFRFLNVVEYMEDKSGELWWCNSHERRATHILKRGGSVEHHCDPKLDGILLPCFAVNLTDKAEIKILGATNE